MSNKIYKISIDILSEQVPMDNLSAGRQTKYLQTKGASAVRGVSEVVRRPVLNLFGGLTPSRKFREQVSD